MHTHMAMAVIEQMIFLPCHCYYCLQRERETRHEAANMKGIVCANMYVDHLARRCCHSSLLILLWSGVCSLLKKKYEPCNRCRQWPTSPKFIEISCTSCGTDSHEIWFITSFLTFLSKLCSWLQFVINPLQFLNRSSRLSHFILAIWVICVVYMAEHFFFLSSVIEFCICLPYCPDALALKQMCCCLLC